MDLDVRGSQAILGPPNYRKLSFLQDSTKKKLQVLHNGPYKTQIFENENR
jgi:hypothetical protein